MDYTATYTGRLTSAQAQDTMRVNLAIEEGSLHAREDGGATWSIPLERVALIRWSERGLRLELAGTEVDFVPEHPDRVLAELVPTLLAGQPQAIPTPAGAPSTVSGPEPPARSDDLVVDLTENEPGPTPAPVAATPRPSRPASRPVPSDTRRRRYRRALAWATLALALAAAVFFLMSRGSEASPEDMVRAALDDAGLTSVAVAVEDGIATLSGTLDTPEELLAAEAAQFEKDELVAAVSNLSISANQFMFSQ